MPRFKTYYTRERDKEAEKTRRQRKKVEEQEHEARRPSPNDPVACAAHEAGGHLIRLSFKLPEGPNGGCGSPVRLFGPYPFPCGSRVDGKPYYCGLCDEALKAEKQHANEGAL